MEATVNQARRRGDQPLRQRLVLASLARGRELSAVQGLFFVLLSLALSLALRLIRLDFQPLWWDEGYSVWFATHPLGQMAALTAQDIHPPLYYALLRAWTLLAGTGPVALRLVSVIAGVGAIPLAYVAGRRLFGRRAGLLAAFLLAINPLHVYYSQEVRMYELMALLSLGILTAAWRVLAGDEPSSPPPPRRGSGRFPLDLRWLLVYVALVTAALYTQYYAVFLPVGITLYAAWRWRRDLRRLAAWLGGQLLAALLYLPWVLYAAPRLVLYVSQKVVADADRPLGLVPYLARHLAAFAGGHAEGPLAPWWPVFLVFLLPLLAGLVLKRREAGRSIAFLGTALGTALVLGWLVGLRYPFFPERGERLLLLALPPFVLLFAAALDALATRARPAFLASLALLLAASGASLAAFYLTPRYAADDYRPLIARTVEQGLPEDTVFCVYPWQVGYWRSYGSAAGPAAVLTPADELDGVVRSTLSDALARGRVWFPAHLALGAILETQIEDYLGERALPFANEWYGPGTRLSAWAEVAAPPAETPVDARFAAPGAASLVLARAGNGDTVRAANDVLPLALDWTAPAAPPVLSVSVRLVDDLGQIWAQHDYEPLGEDGAAASSGQWQAQDRLGVLVGAGTPPGRYHVEVAVSAKGSEQALQATTAAGQSATSVRIGEVDVQPADRALDAERLPIGTRAAVDLDNGIRFLGYSTADGPLAPGETRRVNLFWQAETQPPGDYTAFIQLLDAGGNAIPVWEAPPGAAYPASQWAPGTLIRTQATFRAPATLADGRYRLITGLFRAEDGVRARTPGGRDAIEIGTVTIQGRPHEMEAPAPMYAADGQFGQAARLVGYTLPLWEVPPAPGETIDLRLHWQALGATDRPYTVFVHLVDDAGKVWGYGDSEPGRGALPTTGWLAGEYIDDPHAITIAGDAPSGKYRLAVGLYDVASGQRLATAGGADSVVLGEPVEVRAR